MKTEINKKLGKRIQYLRQQRGLSQEKLAEALNIATTSLSHIETGRGFMTLSTLEKLANILNLEIYEIFQFSSIKTNDEMYNYICKKLSIIKEDDMKLKLLYNFIVNLI
jgi:transcriptional regulator with XRE-family HTH domain